MKTFGVALLAAILGYVVGLFGTMAAIELFSSKQSDKPLEAAMTGAFVGGLLMTVISTIVILTLRRKPRPEPFHSARPYLLPSFPTTRQDGIFRQDATRLPRPRRTPMMPTGRL
jgi:hypothetical protein